MTCHKQVCQQAYQSVSYVCHVYVNKTTSVALSITSSAHTCLKLACVMCNAFTTAAYRSASDTH
jgi:hypothetical protein